jgi:predicted NAD/FAD-binding protein
MSSSSVFCAERKSQHQEEEQGYLREVSLAELQQHNSEESCWVSFGGFVYDVTSFLPAHPGGKEPLLMAGGRALENFWKLFPIHLEKGKGLEELERCPKVGRLARNAHEGVSPAQTNQQWTNLDGFKKHQKSQTRDLVWCAVLGMLLDVATACARFLGWLGLRAFVDELAFVFPVAIPGYGWARPLEHHTTQGKTLKPRIAVVGGGIAGCACAYSLKKAGFDVTLFESRDELGGNAQIGAFTTKGSSGSTTTVTQDLSVLYWCPIFYRNYMALLKAIAVEPQVVSLPYVIKTNAKAITDSSSSNSVWHYYTPAGTALHEQVTSSDLLSRFHDDFVKFDRMIVWVKAINNVFCLDSEPSFYKAAGLFNRVNPLNYISFRGITKVFMISDEFYETIIRPFHGVQFTTHEIDSVPAAAWTVLDEIVPLTKSRTHMSWGPGNSREVFEKMTKGCDVRLGTRVTHVVTSNRNASSVPSLTVSFNDAKNDANGSQENFDRVVLAVPSQYAANIVAASQQQEKRLASFFAQTILRAVQYHDDVVHGDWNLWAEVPVHQDAVNAIDDATYREKLLQHAAFVCDHDAANSGNIMYHSIVSSWSPAVKKVCGSNTPSPMIMTQCLHPHIHIDQAKLVRRFSAPRAHPDMSMKNMVVTQMLRHLQGRDGVYFCGNWTAPGNGHDLSLTSGLVVASAIVDGGFYPFEIDRSAKKDFKMMQRFMGVF